MSTTPPADFAFAQLPPRQKVVGKPFGELAAQMEAMLPDGPEKSAGMRLLRDARNCFVRAALAAPGGDAGQGSDGRIINEFEGQA